MNKSVWNIKDIFVRLLVLVLIATSQSLWAVGPDEKLENMNPAWRAWFNVQGSWALAGAAIVAGNQMKRRFIQIKILRQKIWSKKKKLLLSMRKLSWFPS